MAKVNGFPQSVQSGIPKKNDVPNGWESAPLEKYLYEIKCPAILKDKNIYKLVTVKRNRGGAVERSQLGTFQ